MKVDIEHARAGEAQLRAQIESLQDEINRRNFTTPVVKKSMFDGLSDDQLAIVDALGEAADKGNVSLTEDQIRGATKLNITKNKYAIQELLTSEHIKSFFDDDGYGLLYDLTNKGLNVYIELSTPPSP